MDQSRNWIKDTQIYEITPRRTLKIKFLKIKMLEKVILKLANTMLNLEINQRIKDLAKPWVYLKT